MRRPVFAAGLLIVSLCLMSRPSFATEASCSDLIPQGGAYDRIRSYLSVERRDYLDEITYIKDFGSHDEALKSGISLGVPVYGVPLQIGGTFDSAKKDQWKKEYLNHRKHDVEEDVKRILAADLLNVEVIRIVAECIQMQALGLWIALNIADDCDFSVRVGYIPGEVPARRISGTLRVTNATCDALSKGPLPPSGFVVACRRTSSSTVRAVLHSAALGDREKVLPAVPEPKAPVIQVQSEQTTIRLTASRGQADQIIGNQNCPDCQTKYGIHFAVPGAIKDARLVSTPPAFVNACPDGGSAGISQAYSVPPMEAYATAGQTAGFGSWKGIIIRPPFIPSMSITRSARKLASITVEQ